MKVSDIKNLKVVSTPTISTSSMNNPFNMKVGPATQSYITGGQASVGRAAPDGGNFLTFKDRNAAIDAAKSLLFSSGVYKGLTVDAALKKWSNSGYGGNVVPALANTPIDQRTPDQQTQVLAAMETKGENDAVPAGVKRMTDFKPGQLTLVPPKTQTPPQPNTQSFASKMAGAAKNITLGIGNAGLSTLENIGQGEAALASNIPGLIGQYAKTQLTESQDVQKSGELNAPKGVAGTVGNVIGTVAPYMTGVGEEAGATTLAAKLGGAATRFAANTAIATAQTKSLAQGVETALGGEALSALGVATKAFSGTIGKMFIPKSDAEAAALQTYKAGTSFIKRVGTYLAGISKAPSTAASTAFEKGLVGTESMMGVQAKRAQSKLWSKVINPALKASNVKVDMEQFFESAATKIKASTPELTRQKSLLDALEAVKEDYAGVKQVSLSELQKFKEGFAEFVPEKAYKGQSIAGALKDVRNTLAGLARNHIYAALGDNVKQAYLDYGNLNGITALGRKAMAGGIVKAGGTFTGIKNILETLTVPIGTIAGQTLYKAGQFGEFVGAAGAATLREVLTGNSSSTNGQSQPSQSQSPTSQPTNIQPNFQQSMQQ